MISYPLIANKADNRMLRPQDNFMSDEYIRDHYDLYLTTEYITDEHGETKSYYRLHARYPHTIEMALAYEIKCPRNDYHTLKQVGRCLNSHELGLYECPVCNRK